MTLDIIEIILLIIIGILHIISKSYFSEKAKNTAKAEDLARLTRIVKKVEQKFTIQSEILKSKIDMSTQVQLGLHTESKQALIEAYNLLFDYFQLIINHTLDYINDLENSELIKFRGKIIDKGTLLLAKRGHLNIFVDDEDLVEEIRQMISYLFDKGNKPQLDRLKALKANNNKLAASPENTQELYDERDAIDKTFNIETDKIIDEFGSKLFQLSINIRNYLRKSVKHDNKETS